MRCIPAGVLWLILLSSWGQGCDRAGSERKSNRHPVPASGATADNSSQGHAQPEPPQPEDIRDAGTLAACLRPRLPKGWTLSLQGEHVVIERAEPVEVYNGSSLPHFPSEAERRSYVRPRVRRERFVIYLRIGNRVDQQTYERAVRSNADAIDRARRDKNDLKFMPDAEFWQQHPEYGYQEVPAFDTGMHSIYMKRFPFGAPWCFGSAQVETECREVVKGLGKLFRPYASGDT